MPVAFGHQGMTGQEPEMPKPFEWRIATVLEVQVETPRVKSFSLSAPGFDRFRPGQHVDVRLTAPDGYQAQRSYSIASAPGSSNSNETLDITVELIEDGEVSPYFHEVVREGDKIELRGPIGGPFTWTTAIGGPLLLVGGGSGIVPLMSMLRHRASNNSESVPAALLYSSRTLDDVIYHDELETMAAGDDQFNLSVTLTRERPSGWAGFSGRIDAAMLNSVIEKMGEPAASYVCGPTGFVESAASMLVDRGLLPESIRTERFGPTGS